MEMKLFSVALSLSLAWAASAEYNVRMPSSAACPRWSGAKVGEWTMDYKTAFAQAKAEGRGVLMLTTGSWWCPHCEAFEEKVLLANAARWNDYVMENGYYLVMLDFPYRGHVKDEEIGKSRYPEFGDGWGFQCWLYDDDYLAENGLTRDDGLNAIMDLYRVQQQLALPGATQVSIKSWDGTEDFTYGKVGYPTLLVFLSDGREAGRFSPGATNREVDEAYDYVVEKIDAIMDAARNEDCGLCSEPAEWGLSGDRSQLYRGWLQGGGSEVAGTVEVKTGKKNVRGDIRISATVVTGGKTSILSGLGHDCCIDTVVLSGKGGARLELKLNENGMSGSYVRGDAAFTVTGARDVFSARDAQARTRAGLLTCGTWTMAMSVEESPAGVSVGYGAFSVKVAKSGRATLTGKLPDGTSVSARSCAIIGDSDVYCIPFSIDTYRGKRGGIGFNLWFKNGWLFNVNGLREWQVAGTHDFSVGWRPIYSAAVGAGEIRRELELVFRECPETLWGKTVVSDPDYDEVTTKTYRWQGTEASGFSARYAPGTGMLTGSMRFEIDKGGRIGTRSCRLFGVVVDGTAYCCVDLGKGEGLAAKVSACDACED